MDNGINDLQKNVLIGLYRGVVVDNRDPWKKGRVRIWCYALHGDFTTIPIEALKWSEPIIPISGAFTPPPLWSRVVFGFDTGNKFTPIYLGFWYAIPNENSGAGGPLLPPDALTGTEVPPEGWSWNNLTPEALVIARSGEGNAAWFEQKFVGQNNLACSINLMDTGGKELSIRSFHPNTGNFTSNYDTVDSSKPLATIVSNSGPPNPVRDGTSTPVVAAGSIDLGHKYLKRSLIASSDTFTTDQMQQLDTTGKLKNETEAINGDILFNRCDAALSAMVGNSVFLNGPNGVFISNLRVPPRKY